MKPYMIISITASRKFKDVVRGVAKVELAFGILAKYA